MPEHPDQSSGNRWEPDAHDETAPLASQAPAPSDGPSDESFAAPSAPPPATPPAGAAYGAPAGPPPATAPYAAPAPAAPSRWQVDRHSVRTATISAIATAAVIGVGVVGFAVGRATAPDHGGTQIGRIGQGFGQDGQGGQNFGPNGVFRGPGSNGSSDNGSSDNGSSDGTTSPGA